MSDALDAYECALAQHRMHAFLHGELSERAADELREHLMKCEECMDDFDIESLITALVRRCCPPVSAPVQLRASISYRIVHRYYVE